MEVEAEKMAISALITDCLVDLVRRDSRIIVLNADVAKSVGIRDFGRRCPDRFIQMGVSEQDMFLTAAGLASAGFIPIVTTFAVFASFRAAEQVRTFIAYPRLNVKILVSHGGLSPGQDGVTHQATEDIAVMKAIPNMTVIEPPDARAARALMELAVAHEGPVYMRMSREKLPLVLPWERSSSPSSRPLPPLSIGRGLVLRHGGNPGHGADLAIIAAGSMVSRALEAATILEAEDINASVAAIHTIKPIDCDLIIQLARSTGAIVTAEEHSIHGGLGDAVSMVVEEECPVPVIRVGVRDTFAESGKYSELVENYGLSAKSIVQAARKAYAMKS